MTGNFDELLHQKGSILQVMEHQRRGMRDEINNARENTIKSDPEQFAVSMAEKFTIDIPSPNEAGITSKANDINIDISRDPSRLPFHMGRQAIVKGTEIIITVPFQGDKEVFFLHASSHTMDYPRGCVEQRSIAFRRQGTNLDGQKVRQEFDQWFKAIKKHLSEMKIELGNFNESLKTEAAATVQARLDKFKRDADLISGLGFGSEPSR